MHFYAWQKGLKTGMYYLRTKAARDAIKFTVDKDQLVKQGEEGDGQVKQGNRSVASASADKLPEVTAKQSSPTTKAVATAASGFEEISAEQTAAVGKTCSLDDPDCIACSA